MSPGKGKAAVRELWRKRTLPPEGLDGYANVAGLKSMRWERKASRSTCSDQDCKRNTDGLTIRELQDPLLPGDFDERFGRGSAQTTNGRLMSLGRSMKSNSPRQDSALGGSVAGDTICQEKRSRPGLSARIMTAGSDSRTKRIVLSSAMQSAAEVASSILSGATGRETT